MTQTDPKELYLDIVKRCLRDQIYGERQLLFTRSANPIKNTIIKALKSRGIYLMRQQAKRYPLFGQWPLNGHTMLSEASLDNVRHCLEQAIADNVPGDFIETGVWRGGCCIWARAILKTHGVDDRCVYVADSFQGLPRPNADKYPADAGDIHYTFDSLVVSLDEVRDNFASYGLLDDQVKFLKGWFKDTLPALHGRRWAVIRLDGDMYESTMDALSNLYPSLSAGGFCIVDDYHLQGCKRAIDDYRLANQIAEPIERIPEGGIFWRRRQSQAATGKGVET